MSDTCAACGKAIHERDMPLDIRSTNPNAPPIKVGKYTIRRQAWDENWKPINKDVYFHEECYFNGFIESIIQGYHRYISGYHTFHDTPSGAYERGFPE